jgi:serine protease
MAAGLPVCSSGLASITTRHVMHRSAPPSALGHTTSSILSIHPQRAAHQPGPGLALGLTLCLVAALLAPKPAHALARSGLASTMRPLLQASPTSSEPTALTDRLIVKYRHTPGPTSAQGDRRQAARVATPSATYAATPTATSNATHRAAVEAALDTRAEMAVRVFGNRRGLQLRHIKRLGTGAQVFHVGRVMSHVELRNLAQQLVQDNSEIEYAEPDRLWQVQALPADPLLSQQWSLGDTTGGLRATRAWAQSTGSGVVVAVIDTGVRPHADLADNLLPGYDFITDTHASGDGNGRDADAYDPGDFVAAGYCGAGEPAASSSWHGTHVAGIVAAVGGNGTGISGVAPGALVLPLRALGKCGGYTSDIASAITWAAGDAVAGVPANGTPARVINLSLGGDGSCDRTTQAAIDAARARGAVVVVAAGNAAAPVSTATPANCEGVIAVAATNRSGGRASYSNNGAAVTLAAPGGDRDAAILSTLNSGAAAPGADSYASYMGTSMAAPAVSGVAALVIAANPALTPAQVGQVLTRSARAFPQSCSGCGVGIVDASAAVAAALGTTAEPAPGTTPGSPTAPGGAPEPAIVPLAVAEQEGNNTRAKAQVIASLPAVISGKLGSTSDTDYFRIELAPGQTVTAVMTLGGAKLKFKLNAYTLGGKLVVSANGPVGQPRQFSVRNAGSGTVQMLLRVLRASGGKGSYELALGV